MRRVFNIVLTALAAVILSVGSSSCVKEDLSNCPIIPDDGGKTEARTLKLMFVPRQMDVTPSQEDLKLAVVYVFDPSGAVFKTWTKQNPALNTPYDTGIILDASVAYRLVAWINPEAPYTVTPAYTATPTRSALTYGRVSLTIPPSGDVTEKIPMLLYGSKEQVIRPTEDTTVEIPLTLDTYDLTVTIKGVPLDGSQYRLQVNDTNGAYDFNNNFIETVGFDYQGFATAGTGGGTGDLVITLRTLRLAPNRSPLIGIVNMTSGTVVFPSGAGTTGATNLMELIGQTGVDLSTTYKLNIEITPPPTENDGTANTSTVITINGWRVVLEGGIVIINE